ncbi:endolytic transglycosylase MltG, partial [Escherichia coli]
ILAKLTNEYTYPEGLFFPDTYLFAKGASDMQVYKQAFALMSKKLNEAWARRDLSLPYRTPYEALTMASIVEK